MLTFVFNQMYIIESTNKDINRLKVVLAEKKRTNKWLAEQLGKDPGTVSNSEMFGCGCKRFTLVNKVVLASVITCIWNTKSRIYKWYSKYS